MLDAQECVNRISQLSHKLVVVVVLRVGEARFVRHRRRRH